MESKRGKRIKTLIIALIILIFLLVFVIISFNKSISGKVIFTPPIPSDCSNESVKALWDSIFNEPSSNIIIYTNSTTPGRCDQIVTYKLTNSTILSLIIGSYYMQNPRTLNNEIRSYRLNVTTDYASKLSTITLPANISFLMGFGMSDAENRSLILTNANNSFTSDFKITTSNWYENSGNFIFNLTEINSDNNITIIGSVNSNKSINYVYWTKSQYIPCNSNWTQHNSTCNNSEYLLTWYTDQNLCETPTNYPGNSTLSCNYNNDSIFGNPDNFNAKLSSSMGISITIFINGTSNLSSQNFTNKTEKVEIKGLSKTYIEFDWDFSEILDLNQINIEKGNSGNKSYMIINNINSNKTIYLDPINYSGKVCIKNSEISSISAISSACNRADRGEILLNCPGSQKNISCLIGDNATYIIKGLTNSGAIEHIENSSSCSPFWNCSGFSTCVNGMQNRICTDTNYCNNLSTRPSLTQSCNSSTSSNPTNCTSSWNWTSWSSCINKTQTRTGKDKNNCQADKTESKECSSSFLSIPNYVYYGLITIIAITIVIVLLTLIITLFSHGSSRGKNIFSS